MGKISHRVHTIQKMTEYEVLYERCLRVKAFMRSRLEKDRAERRKKLRRTAWCAILWVWRVRRFSLERLAAFTLQTTIREMFAMAEIQNHRVLMRRDNAKRELQTIILTIKARKVTVKGPHGQLFRDLSHIHADLRVEDGYVIVSIWFSSMKYKACLRSCMSAIVNLITGVTEKFQKTMR